MILIPTWRQALRNVYQCCFAEVIMALFPTFSLGCTSSFHNMVAPLQLLLVLDHEARMCLSGKASLRKKTHLKEQSRILFRRAKYHQVGLRFG